MALSSLLDALCSAFLANYHALSCPPLPALLPSFSYAALPVPPSLSLFANLATLSRLHPPPLPPAVPALLALLMPALPLATFSPRASIFWVTEGQTNTAIVIPESVTSQAKSILVDSFIRKLAAQYLSPDPAVLDSILSPKSPADMAHEAALTSASAADLATADATPVRKKSWFASGPSLWAKKLANAFTADISSKPKPTQPSPALMNTSKVSRQIAQEGALNASPALTLSRAAPTAPAVPTTNLSSCLTIAPFLAHLLARWNGAGFSNIATRQKLPENAAAPHPEPSLLAPLNILCFSTPAVKALWCYLISPAAQTRLDAALSPSHPSCLATTSLTATGNTTLDGVHSTLACLSVFAALLSTTLALTDDRELATVLPQHHLLRVILLFKRLLNKAVRVDLRRKSDECDTAFGCSLVASCERVLRELYDRSSRKPLCTPALWLVDDHGKVEQDIAGARTFRHLQTLLHSPFFRVMPFAISLKARLRMFEMLVSLERRQVQGVNEEGTLRPGVGIRIQRGRILEDGLLTMNKLGTRMKQRLMIQYVNEAGMNEAGIDVGGLFKDFWTDLSKLAFSPDYALFLDTDEGMYPSPVSFAAHGADHVTLFEFLGRILGKALFEGITIQPLFSHFFLSFLRGGYNYNNMMSDLSTKDKELYKNLMFLKHYEGDAADLCLTMSVMEDDFGEGKEIPLVPGGADIDVTNMNKLRYIHLVAKYHMSDRIRVQSESFARGLWEVIPPQYLHLFNESELQVLVSGVGGGKVDVEDMRRHCQYGGGYTGMDRNVSRFWEVVAGFSDEERRLLMRFVTSCERPPPLGFSSLQPPFCVTRVGVSSDNEKLPMASTCFNVLKLPTYSSKSVMKAKLLLAITSGTGFELS